jgi:CSLREA domain-containing protein
MKKFWPGKRLCRNLDTGSWRFFAALIMSALLGIMVAGHSYAQEQSAADIQVTIEAPAQVGVGNVITLRLRAEGDAQIGGFEALLLYSPTDAEFAGFSPRPPQGDQGLGQLVVPELPVGSVVGFYTCGTDPCLNAREAQVQAAAEPGVLGQVELLGLTPGQLQINIGHIIVVDSAGHPLSVTMPQTSVVVQVGEDTQSLAAPTDALNWQSARAASATVNATAADITQDGNVSHSDVMEAALEWEIDHETSAPCGGSESSADINGDGCIDIVDVQTAAAFASGQTGPKTNDPYQWPQQLFLPNINSLGNPDAQSSEIADTEAVMTFTVNSVLDEYDAYSNDNKCLSPSGVCTLRAAIQQSINRSGPEVILFDIPGGGVQTIQLGSRLPSLWDSSAGIIIDGYSQPGAVPNTDPLVSNAHIMIQIRGNGFDQFDGLAITSAGNVVKGLSFFNLKRSLWIYGSGAHNNTIEGNFIGTDAAGTFGAKTTSTSQAHGIHVEQGASNNQIGGTALADRNIISGNARHGIGLWHSGTTNNLIINNIIGLTPDGARRLSNRVHGMDINFGASNNTVGGTNPGERNVISGNNGSGAEVSHEAITRQNVFRGNYIGTDTTGNAAGSYTANGLYGISMKDRASNNLATDNVVGNNLGGGVHIDNFGNCCTSNNTIQNNRIGIGVNGAAIGNALFGVLVLAPNTHIGPGNIIANNPVGIQIEGDDDDANIITQNSIFNNVGLGIDLAPVGQVNDNDPGDADTGPNEQQNFPVINSATTSTVSGTACLTCTVEIFIADSGANAYGEGKTFVGSGSVASDGTFTILVSGPAEGDYVTATAIDAVGNTSEFSLNHIVGSGAPLPWEVVFPIPGRIEAENYRSGGQGNGYSDTTTGNSGRVYRNDDVDIETTQDSSGSYDIGWIAPGEWLSYNTNVAATGNYKITARISTPSGSRRFHIEIDGNNVSGPVTMPWTGGWQNWADVSVVVPLTAGQHVLRFVAETDRFNFNYLDITAQ